MARKPQFAEVIASPTNGSLPKGWRRVRFGEVVRDVTEAERNPLDAGLERFVGLEHIEPENLHLKQWGNLTDGDVSFTKRFRKGQVLFGKRRAYQRKVAIAEFDGICSSDILTFEPSSDELIPELLPFIVQSNGFFEHALDTSSGSLSPRTRWSQLQDYEFPLPPKDEQRRIADILWAADEAVEAWTSGHAETTKLYELMLKDVFESNHHRWPKRSLESVARVERGKFDHRPRNLPEFYGGPHPFVQTGDVQRANRILSSFEYTLTDLGVTHSKMFPTGTILVSIAAVIGATAITDRPVYVTDSVVGIVSSPDMNIDFLELFLRSRRSFLENQAATQTAQKNINLQVLRPLEVPCPPLTEQVAIAKRILSTWEASNKIREHASALRVMSQIIRDTSLGATHVH